MSHYQPRHGIPTEVPVPSNHRRTVGVAVAGSATLLIVAVIVVVSLPGNGTGPGRAVATSSLQGAAPKGGGDVRTRGRSSLGSPSTSTLAAPRATGTTSPGATAGPAINLAVPAGFGPLLRKAWVAADPGRSGLVRRDIASTLAGSVFYAEQSSAGIYWAISRFVPSPLLEQAASSRIGKVMLDQFNDVSVFDQVPGHAWHYVGAFSPGSCPTNVPNSVSAAWGLCSVGS
ncbi:MAG: hypothetical protein ABSE77_02690 [Acidimicrobiales bacterium]